MKRKLYPHTGGREKTRKKIAEREMRSARLISVSPKWQIDRVSRYKREKEKPGIAVASLLTTIVPLIKEIGPSEDVARKMFDELNYKLFN